MKFPGVKNLKRREKILIPRVYTVHNTMSGKTKDFIQKMYNKKFSVLDITRNGFINSYSNKMHNITYFMKPLKTKLDKMMGRPTEKIIIPRRRASIITGHKRSKKIPGAAVGTRRSAKSCDADSGTMSPSTSSSVQTVQAKPHYTAPKKKSRWSSHWGSKR